MYRKLIDGFVVVSMLIIVTFTIWASLREQEREPVYVPVPTPVPVEQGLDPRFHIEIPVPEVPEQIQKPSPPLEPKYEVIPTPKPMTPEEIREWEKKHVATFRASLSRPVPALRG